MADRLGQRFGNFRLFQLLGQGGFAEVYLGKHVVLDTLAAIKVYRTQLAEQDIQRFRLEARIISHLVHPHILRVLEFGVEENAPYLIMNYAPGGSLRQRHPKGSRIPLATVVSYVNQISSALQFAHEQKLIHRHIKPQNFLVGNANEILLSDFGIVSVDQNSRYRSQRDMVETITYMAPEQIEARPQPASDQYSLGIVVYEWLAGEPPFQGSFAELPARHKDAPPPPLPNIAPTVEAVVMKALAKDWTQRFTDIRAFATALEEASNFENEPTMYSIPPSQGLDATIAVQFPSQQPAGEAASTGQQASHGISRRVVVSGLLGLLALGAIGGGIVWFSRRTAPPVSSSTSSSITPTPAPPKLPASSPMFGFNPQHTSFNANEYVLSSSNVTRLVPYWTAPTGDIIDSTPAVVGKAAYVGSHDSKVYACDIASGNVLWTAATGGAITSSPAVVNGVVYIGSADNNLYALNADTGETLWKAPAGDVFLSSPTVVNGVLYIGSNDHKLYAINAATGSMLWTVSTGDSITASPSVINGVVYVGSNDHTMYAVDDFTGTILWSASTGDIILAASAIANGVVYVGSADHLLYALDATTGKTIWTVSTGDRIGSGCAVANGVVYVGSEDHKLYACDATTGKVLWSATTGDRVTSSPVVVNGVVYIGSFDHKLYAFHLPG